MRVLEEFEAELYGFGKARWPTTRKPASRLAFRNLSAWGQP